MIGSCCCIVWLAAAAAPSADAELAVESLADRLVITHGRQPVATYVFRDDKILRPYFAHVHAPGGVQVTRHHPPRPGADATDHDTMHPGIWLAFGDLGGADFWRNKARVLHVEFAEQPSVKDGVLTFTASNRYSSGERTVCRELARHAVRRWKDGWLLTLDSQFTGDEPFAFGDQEEMGLGMRLATQLAVKGGSGTITSSEGRQNEKEVWGRQAQWCDYGGLIDGRAAGMLLMPHPENFGPSWLHVREYGLAVANPFGQNAFTKGTKSRIEVKPGETLRLRFAVYAYAGEAKIEPAEAFREYATSK